MRNWTSYIIVEKEVLECSVKYILHHQTIVTKLKYYCQHCDNVDMLQKKHLCFLLQFMVSSKVRDKQTSLFYLNHQCLHYSGKKYICTKAQGTLHLLTFAITVFLQRVTWNKGCSCRCCKSTEAQGINSENIQCDAVSKHTANFMHYFKI